MDAPPVQYAHTTDGVSIPYAVHGTGPPLLYSGVFSHLELDWKVPEFERWMVRLGASWRVIRYDPRGFGLSDRADVAVTRGSHRADVEAVLDAAGAERALLFSTGGPATSPSVLLAHDLGERWAAFAPWNGILTGLPPPMRALIEVERLEEDLFNRTCCMWRGWEEPESRRLKVEAYVGSGQPAWRQEHMEDRSALNDEARAALPDIGLPVLLIAPERTDGGTSAEGGLELARGLRNVQRITLPETAYDPGVSNTDAIVRGLEQLDAQRLDAAAATCTPPSAFQTILFTDLESSTALTQRLGDEGAQELLRGHKEAVRSALAANGGCEVKHTGDGIMASFPSAVSAVEASLAIQREMAGGEVRVRIGLNAGEPIAEDDDRFGTAVQLAARITDRVERGQVLVSRVVADLCAGKGFDFTSAGDATMKGFDEPVALFAVQAG